MTLNKLPRGFLEIPKGTNTCHSENSDFLSHLVKTNSVLSQYVSSSDASKKAIMRQELEESYFTLTIYSLKDSIVHKVEQDMWNNLFKKSISDLQSKIKNKDKTEAASAQVEYAVFLDEAVGFYSKYIDILSLVYDIQLPCPKHFTKQNYLIRQECVTGTSTVTETDLRYILQHCFVHLGDLFRYQNLTKQAKFYYDWAVKVNPTSGHAYNQLAILTSNSVSHSTISSSNFDRIIHMILLYDYACTCLNPFPATRINLESILRHITDESVSELLTSSNIINDENGFSYFSIAWLHVYAELRLRNNIQRCRQLQQRIIDWIGDLVVKKNVFYKYKRTAVSIVALQCSLLSTYMDQQESPETKLWSLNLQQFTQSLMNTICRGLLSVSHDVKVFKELINNEGPISVMLIFFCWLHQFVTVKENTKIEKSTNDIPPMKVPFGEDFIKFLNFLLTDGNVELSLDKSFDGLPVSLPELNYLKGYNPIKVPFKKLELFANAKLITNESLMSDEQMRLEFILFVSRQIASKWNSLLLCNNNTAGEKRFSPAVVPENHTKKATKIEPTIFNRKPVNIALASLKNNALENNVLTTNDKRKVSISNIVQAEIPTGGIADVKIAKCIQEQIAYDTFKMPANEVMNSKVVNTVVDDSGSFAPAPGLILSSSLPPDYKAMSVVTVNDITKFTKPPSPVEVLPSDIDLIESIKSANNLKNHSYNPNREQFEKDLPPRFANKRSTSQKENKGGFTSMNYWDSMNEFPLPSNNFEANLAKKESEILLPPTVPTSWLNDDRQNGVVNGPSINVAAVNNNTSAQQQLRFPFNSNLQTDTATRSINNQPPTNHINMLSQPPLFNQYQNISATNDQENQLQYMMQSTTQNANSYFPYRTQASGTGINFDQMNVVSQQRSNGQNSNPLQPTQQQLQQHANPPQNFLFNHQTKSSKGSNFDQFNHQHMPNFYDKPVFSTSGGQTGFSYATAGSLMAHQAQQQQQQVRHNNPLLNLLPGFLNETQR